MGTISYEMFKIFIPAFKKETFKLQPYLPEANYINKSYRPREYPNLTFITFNLLRVLLRNVLKIVWMSHPIWKFRLIWDEKTFKKTNMISQRVMA